MRGARLCGLAVVLALAAPAARAETIYDATGGSAIESGADPIGVAEAQLEGRAKVGPILADRFVATQSGTLSDVSLELQLGAGGAMSGFEVALFADDGVAGPGAVEAVVANVADSTIGVGPSLYSYAPLTGIDLLAGQSYYIGVIDADTGVDLSWTFDQTVLDRASVQAGGFFFNDYVGAAAPNSEGPYAISVAETPIPAPGFGPVLAAGIVFAGWCRRSRKIGGAVPAPPNPPS